MSKATPTASGSKIGVNFLWVDVEIARLPDREKIAIMTVRAQHTGGRVLARTIADGDIATRLRQLAKTVDDMVAAANQSDDVSGPEPHS